MNRFPSWLCLPVTRLIAAGLLCLVAVPAATTTRAAEALAPLELGQVRLGGELGRRVDVTIENNLLTLDADGDFLQPFREKSRGGGYIGLGKLIDAAVRFAVYSKDEKVTDLKDHLVDAVIEAQEEDGYIGMFAPQHRMHRLWDVHEMGYIIHGLTTDYQYFGDERSLEAAQKAADYIIRRWSAVPEDWGEQTGVATWVGVTGLERAMIRLHGETGQRRYLDFCLDQRELGRWDPQIVIGRRPLIEGHIYAYLCRSLAQIELRPQLPQGELLAPAQQAMQFMTRGDGMAITGGCGQWEIWTADQDGRGALAETCATAYQVRVFDRFLRQTGEPFYGDVMERMIYNTLFAAQSPDGRRIRYYTPFEDERAYHPGDTYCCPCNYRRIIAELPEMVYYQSGNAVAVNLYTPSKANLELPGAGAVTITQQTNYPNSGRVTLRVDPEHPAEFELRLRIPAWCSRAEVTVNDRSVTSPEGKQFYSLRRNWEAGDTVVLEMPMDWRLVRGRKRQSGRAAVMRGPVVFCLNPAQNEKIADWDGADLSRITLDPASLGEPAADDSVRPDGIACPIQAWTPGYATARPGDLELRLTEFADPGGRAIYFRLQDLSLAEEDELLRGDGSGIPGEW